MDMISDYEKKVYTAITGKVIGVYLGRPYEGMLKKDIQKRWGAITRYVHEDCAVPLVVCDDDISGTLAFIRALEDSGLYRDTPPEAFGDMWLNYLLENQTVLWWGGMSLSTEHTAFLRLKSGLKAPESGSIARNGKVVAEQIGAQIFIDAFGMVAPGEPQLAADLARRSASVSHDGEAVYAAMVVAAMVSAAFVQRDMNQVLDIGVSVIPADSLIAQIHRDVRSWSQQDGDWNKTFERIDHKYGYRQYGGNCHVVPNHAVMVMAWAYAQADFFRAMEIACTAGWDTDCNAANVGSVSALIAGLEHLGDGYDFRTPYADRIRIPTADGTDSTTDVLREAWHIAAIGRKVMNWPSAPLPKNGVWHHFEMPGALHGYQADESTFALRHTVELENVARAETRCLALRYKVDAGHQARILTPTNLPPGDCGYASVSTPVIYPGYTMLAEGMVGETIGAGALRMVVQLHDGSIFASDALPLQSGKSFALRWTLEALPQDACIVHFGFEVIAAERAAGELWIDRVDYRVNARLGYCGGIPHVGAREVPGWISNMSGVRASLSEDVEPMVHFCSNVPGGLLITGNRDWRDGVLRCRLNLHAADRVGVLVRYQGARRYHAAWMSANQLTLSAHFDGSERILAQCDFACEPDRLYAVEVTVSGDMLTLKIDGESVLAARDARMNASGGMGFGLDSGLFGVCGIHIEAK